MKKSIAILILCASTACAAVREVRPPMHMLPPHDEPPTLAELMERRSRMAALRERGAAMRELAGVGTNALDSAAVSNQVRSIRERAAMLDGLRAVIADTRANMPEATELGDAEVAGLYMAQMRKPAPPLVEAAPTNTIEYAIGAGMRHDLQLTGDTNGHD